MTTKAKLTVFGLAAAVVTAGAASLASPRHVYGQDACPGGTVVCTSMCVQQCNSSGKDCVWICATKPAQQE